MTSLILILPYSPTHCRLLMFYEDWRGVKKLLAKAKSLCDQVSLGVHNGIVWVRMVMLGSRCAYYHSFISSQTC